MKRIALWIIAAGALALAACGQSGQPVDDSGSPASDASRSAPAPEDDALTPLPEVEQALLDAPSSAFVAIEPTELGVIAAPTVMEAIAPLIGLEAYEEGASVHLSVRESGDAAVADIVRSNIPDDAVQAGQIRIEFRREPEGWFPTNAYRRTMCRRGDEAGQWTTELCP